MSAVASLVVSLPVESPIGAQLPARPVRIKLETSTRAANAHGNDIKLRILALRLATGGSARAIAKHLGVNRNMVCEVLKVTLQQIQAAPRN